MVVIPYSEYPESREWNAKVFSLPKIPRAKEGQTVVLRKILQAVIDKTPYNTRMKFEGSDSRATLDKLCSWLRPVGLVYNCEGTWEVSAEAKRWLDTEDDLYLTAIFCANIRFVAELLVRLNEPKKMSELQQISKEQYHLNWETTSEINNRLTWLRQVDLVEFTDYMLTYSLTKKGREFAENIFYVKSDEIIVDADTTIDEIEIPISDWSLQMCQLTQEKLKARKQSIGYVAGNMSEFYDTVDGYIQLMHTAIDIKSIISYSQRTYGLAVSSVKHFLSTLTKLDMVERKTKTLYEASDLGKKWLITKLPLDLVCYLQTKVLFIFELLKELEKNSLSVKELASIAKISYGFEIEKTDEIRKRITIMKGALLIQEDGSDLYCLTERARKLLELVTVQQKEDEEQRNEYKDKFEDKNYNSSISIDGQLTELRLASRDSSNPDRFERAVQCAFSLLGFKAEWLGGSGKTDVLLHAPSVPKYSYVVTVDAKSTQSGSVTEGQINFDTLKEHKKLHSADYVAVVGFSFQGDRLVKWAIEHNVVLIDLDSLEKMIRLHKEVPLQYEAYRKIFSHPGIIDISFLEEDRRIIKRYGVLLQAVMDCLVDESSDPVTQGFLQDRDIYRTLRSSKQFDTLPDLEEISAMLDFLASPLIGCIGRTKDGYYALGALADAANKFKFYAKVCLSN